VACALRLRRHYANGHRLVIWRVTRKICAPGVGVGEDAAKMVGCFGMGSDRLETQTRRNTLTPFLWASGGLAWHFCSNAIDTPATSLLKHSLPGTSPGTTSSMALPSAKKPRRWYFRATDMQLVTPFLSSGRIATSNTVCGSVRARVRLLHGESIATSIILLTTQAAEIFSG